MTNEKNTARATDPNDLERQILDPNIAKTEAEWWAKRRIEELEREVYKWRGASRVKHLEAIEWAGKHQLLAEHCNALQADNARLREALRTWVKCCELSPTIRTEVAIPLGALAATPAQSLDALLDPYKARIAQLEAENATLNTDFSNLRAKVFTNGDRRITLKDRTFTVEGDGLLFDNNFDFDACLRVSGDFAGDEKQQYAQMIADALNTVGCGD